MTAHKNQIVLASCILAGGQSSRMGGGDKTLLELAGQPVLAHILARLRPQVRALALNANGNAARFAPFGAPVIADTVAGQPGPLAGLLAGMRWAAANVPGVTHLLTASADAPFLPADFAERMQVAVREDANRIAIALVGGQPHPTAGLWPVSLADQLERDLRNGARSVLKWLATLPNTRVAFEPVQVGRRTFDPFFNVNTPVELVEARLVVQPFASPVIGIAGWKNSGKTTLVTRLIAELTARGHAVSTIKFSHHEFDPASGGHDTDLHRAAGAKQVAFAGPERWAIVEGSESITWQSNAPEREQTLTDIVAQLRPVDLVLIEGFKSARVPKIEVRRTAAKEQSPLDDAGSYVFAILSDQPVSSASEQWIGGLDDMAPLASLIEGIALRGT